MLRHGVLYYFLLYHSLF